MKLFLKVLTLILSLSVGLVQAEASGSLSGLVLEYHYQMTVEWDQRDEEFKEKAQAQFFQGIEELKSRGLKEQELLRELEPTLKNPQVMNEMVDLRLKYSAGLLSSSEFSYQVLEVVKKDQMQGASWSGRTTIVVGVTIALAVAWVVWTISVCRSEGCNPRDSF